MTFLKTIFPWIVFFHSLAFLGFWMTNQAFTIDTNDFLSGKLDRQMDYILLFLLISGFLALWSLVRAALAAVGAAPSQGLQIVGDWFYFILGALYIVLFYGSFVYLFREAPGQWVRLEQMIQYYRVILDPVLLLVLALIARGWLRQAGFQWGKAVPVLLALAVLWSLALIFKPGSVYQGSLPTKPRLIAHRGASMLAPENTLASTQKAVELGAYGIETDIRVSQDGALFLMHDDTLTRTTNIAQVFPDRKEQRAEAFTQAEIDRLSAGSWFVEEDLYGMVRSGKLTEEQIDVYKKLAIPSFADWLKTAHSGGKVIIFDLLFPPNGHPYYSQIFEMVFRQIQSEGMDGQTWFLADKGQAAYIKQNGPQMILTVGIDTNHPPSAEELVSVGYKVVNSEYILPAEAIRRYKAAGLWVNLWTVDERWQFSRDWLMGVDSITTNNLPGMIGLNAPLLAVPYLTYLLMWAAVGGISALLLFFAR